MVFLPGDHTLEVNITVANIARLTMYGESLSGDVTIIVCSESVGINFTSIMELKINSLAFTTCGRNSLTPTGAKKFAMLLESIEFAELVNCSFHDNLGSALAVYNTNIPVMESTEFVRNHYESSTPDSNSYVGGGGITALSSNLTFIGNTTFIENSASYDSGGIYMMRCNLISTGNIHFINNTNMPSSIFILTADAGAIWASASSLQFTRINNFIGNLAHDAGAIYAEYTALNFTGASNFNRNHGGIGAISTSYNVNLVFNGTTNFVSNGGGGIRASANTSLLLHGTVTLIDNKASKWGGGVYLGGSTLSVFPNTTVYWERNHADLGGAIYVDDELNTRIYCRKINTCEAKEDCFFQLPGQNLSNGIQAKFIFRNNSVDSAGSVLYGGAVDYCKLTGQGSHTSGEVFDMLVHIEDENTTTSIISSAPFGICPCEHKHPDCTTPSTTNTVYPGETFQVSVAAVGQRHGMISSLLSTRASNGHLVSKQYIQFVYNTCTTLNYTVFSQHNSAGLELYADGPCSTFGDRFLLVLEINQTCPPGFSYSQNESSCACEPRIEKYTNHCDITNGLGRITRGSNQHFWIGYDTWFHVLILHPHCPFDHCVFNRVDFPLNDTDLQCLNNRSGLLCGACKTNFSLILGNSQCKQCTNTYLTLLIPFALMGVALVMLLFICKLTVATGALSGLIFYANIVGVNRSIFLPVKTTDAFSVFISWLNLDFGINSCFYDGMDAYSKTWLQFVFPVYVWVIVGLMILVSQYSKKFANLLGSNPVAVLATLILLSYTKVLRTLIAAVSITYLEYPTYNRGVWLHDANLDYLSGKHIPLFLVATLVFFILFLPYTLLLLFGQWLKAMSHLRIFAWANSARLVPFMDPYHAPYKPKHRYWPGLLLVFRFVLLQFFAFNALQDPNISLLGIQVGTAMLQLWAWISHGVYRNWCLDALEGSFALNLIILAAATMYINITGGNQLAVGYTSVAVAFITFIGIIASHILQQTNLWKKIPKINITFYKLNEPVNDAEEVEESDRLRESLLEDPPQPNYGAV